MYYPNNVGVPPPTVPVGSPKAPATMVDPAPLRFLARIVASSAIAAARCVSSSPACAGGGGGGGAGGTYTFGFRKDITGLLLVILH